jgi:fructokinase
MGFKKCHACWKYADNKPKSIMIVVIGEILIDRFPDYERIGGAPFNFAFHLRQMGWPVRFLTRIGDDAAGLRIL